MRRLLEPATRLALALDHPAYDCTYLALAEMLSCPMVIADERLNRKLRSGGLEKLALPLAAIR